MARRVKFKLNIRSVKDLEAARKLYNFYLLNGSVGRALDIATQLSSFGYEGWDKKCEMIQLMYCRRR